MTDKKLESVMRKIRACLARADKERNDNEQERATALRMANTLMDKYSVSILDLGDGDAFGPRGENKIAVGQAQWKYSAFGSIAKLYGCQLLCNTKGYVYVVGRQHYRGIVIDMAHYVCDSIDREAIAGSGDRKYKASFRVGACSGVRANVVAIIADRSKRETKKQLGTALILVDHYKKELVLNQEWLVKAHPKIKKGKKINIGNMEAYVDGMLHGQSIGLQDQLGSS